MSNGYDLVSFILGIICGIALVVNIIEGDVGSTIIAAIGCITNLMLAFWKEY